LVFISLTNTTSRLKASKNPLVKIPQRALHPGMFGHHLSISLQVCRILLAEAFDVLVPFVYCKQNVPLCHLLEPGKTGLCGRE
jgi:hypothetical protein